MTKEEEELKIKLIELVESITNSSIKGSNYLKNEKLKR